MSEDNKNLEQVKNKPDKYDDEETKKEGSTVETVYKYNDARRLKINE
jgi:hypothetical protein